MPKRQDISSVLVIGSGPIVIGQACEFDYSGVQACRVLKAEGYRVILVNSNPATIMTDPEFAHATYIEPLDAKIIAKIIEKERPDALLPTLGGQTALNLAIELVESGVLEKFAVELIGASEKAIHTAENRELFKIAMQEIGLETPQSGFAHSLEEAVKVGEEIGFPVMIRPSFILGGAGTGIAANLEQFVEMAASGLDASPISEILIERSIAGWKEYELEVMRDHKDNAVIVCSIENFDPMGVHTGDSITVAPAQTLSDFEYQLMRDAAFKVIRRIGVETGGSNIQFAIDPSSGEMVVIEMNPRVSRSSALASKATGFPIAKIATKLAIGYTLDEVENDITKLTPASFEPSIDYVVTKVPRWAFEKFPGVEDELGTRMQSVGEAMAIGRSFPESLQKALRSIERGRYGLNCDPIEVGYDALSDEELLKAVSKATSERIFQIEAAIRRKIPVPVVYEACKVDPWFLDQIALIVAARESLVEIYDPTSGLESLDSQLLFEAKQLGFSDAQLGYLLGVDESEVTSYRRSLGVRPSYKAVDTCAAEFEAYTPYFYSTYDDENEVEGDQTPTVIILGSGPNRIGQGIEFDYCCVHASFALREAGYKTVMVNCNPETVSTDYDTSDRLYMEPLMIEEVTEVLEVESRNPNFLGVIVSLGGQTPLKLASSLPAKWVLGTSARAIDFAEDREQWSNFCDRVAIAQPPGATVYSLEEALEVVQEIGYPVLLRPSYVLGGRAMEIVYDENQLKGGFARLKELETEGGQPSSRPILIDKFLEDAIEVDVDAVRDRAGETYIGGIMEHVEEAGVHSGDSACAIPPQTLSDAVIEQIRTYAVLIANELEVVGLINVQFAVQAEQVYVIEANPRASRTVPFVAKSTGVPLAKLAALVMVGKTLEELREAKLFDPPAAISHVAVKEAVLPFSRFPTSDTLLGPEMRSTGEVMGIDSSFPLAFSKSQLAAGSRLADSGVVLFSLSDRDKEHGVEVAKAFRDLGFELAATVGTSKSLDAHGVEVGILVAKVTDEKRAIGEAREDRPVGHHDAVDLISSGKVVLVVNTPRGNTPRADGYRIRSAALKNHVACLTTLAAAKAAASAIKEARKSPFEVRTIQSFHQAL